MPDSPQLRTLLTYTHLHALRQNWPGQLILNLNLDPQGTAVSLASNILGAVCLSIEEDPAKAHQALRTGACDFVVNTLDEALRAIKNEIRKHRPLAVGLQGPKSGILDELLERGVAPTVLTGLATQQTKFFEAQGTTIPDLNAPTPGPYGAYEFTFPTPAALKEFDAAALALLPQDDHLRRTWLTAAPRLFPRERPPLRTLWLTESEREALPKGAL